MLSKVVVLGFEYLRDISLHVFSLPSLAFRLNLKQNELVSTASSTNHGRRFPWLQEAHGAVVKFTDGFKKNAHAVVDTFV